MKVTDMKTLKTKRRETVFIRALKIRQLARKFGIEKTFAECLKQARKY